MVCEILLEIASHRGQHLVHLVMLVLRTVYQALRIATSFPCVVHTTCPKGMIDIYGWRYGI